MGRRQARASWPVAFPIEIVVPEITDADESGCLLVTPDLGEPLAMRLGLAAKLLRRSRLIGVLHTFLDAGVEAPGFVPRNLFHRDGCLYVIDWEDAAFISPPARVSALTVMKWDIAWSDAFASDPQLRLVFADRLDDGPAPDEFEQALADLTRSDRAAGQIRADGIAITLTSELHVPVILWNRRSRGQ